MIGLESIVVPGWAFKEGIAAVERSRALRDPSVVPKAEVVCAASYAHAHAN